VARYLKDRSDRLTAAVYDVGSKRTYLFNPGVHEVTASMAKIDILADLLYEDQRAHRSLSAKDESLAVPMIEDSDNADAQILWTQIGGRDAIDSFNALIGFTQTIPSWGWGLIDTTPRDQLQLLKVIALPNRILTTASREYEMSLMEGVTAGQRFGIGWGAPAKATVGLKDGYYPEKATGWQLNSSGFVKYKGRFYLTTIMDSGSPEESAGINTLTKVASLIWEHLRP
jgi:hypothetical protein